MGGVAVSMLGAKAVEQQGQQSRCEQAAYNGDIRVPPVVAETTAGCVLCRSAAAGNGGDNAAAAASVIPSSNTNESTPIVCSACLTDPVAEQRWLAICYLRLHRSRLAPEL